MDVNLNFNNHISDLCKKASKKISELAIVAPFVSLDEKKLIINAFFTSRFSYWPQISIYHSRTNNRKISTLYERCLRISYNDKQSSSFNQLLNKGSSVSVYIRNFQRLAIEMFKFYKGLSTTIMNNGFKLKTEIPIFLG